MKRDIELDKYYKKNPKDTHIRFTPLELVPLEVNEDSLLDFLINTGFVLAKICTKLRMSSLTTEVQEVYDEMYIELYKAKTRLYNVYENNGYLAFIGYVKTIINIQSYFIYKKLLRDPNIESITYDTYNQMVELWDGESILYTNKTDDLNYGY